MYSRWLMGMLAIAAAAPLAAQDPDAEIALHGCKQAVIEHVIRTGGRSVSTVRFPPGALVWIAKQTGSRVQGAGQYRTGAREWHDFTYTCAYDHADASAKVKVQRGEDRDARASQSSQDAPATAAPTPPRGSPQH